MELGLTGRAKIAPASIVEQRCNLWHSISMGLGLSRPYLRPCAKTRAFKLLSVSALKGSF